MFRFLKPFAFLLENTAVEKSMICNIIILIRLYNGWNEVV